MKLALFSDVHGRLRIVLHLLRCWQMANKAELDGALIAGDLGCFPDRTKFDNATRRWLERDPEEAGFADYFMNPNAEVNEMLNGTPELGPFSAVRCPVLFVPGNHEDYAYLLRMSKNPNAPGAPAGTFAVDCYQAFHCIHNGEVVTLTSPAGGSIRIAGLWGIENTSPGAPYRISRDAVTKLVAGGKDSFDLLLTHDVPSEAYPREDSTQITEILRACRPPFHLFGHAHPIHDRHLFSLPNVPTQCWILEDVYFGKECNGSLTRSMALLDWDGRQGSVEMLEADWLTQMRFGNWRYVLPKFEIP